MADPTTPNYGFNLPTVGGDDNAWGDLLNANWTAIDSALWSVSGVANAALTQSAGDARYLRLTGGTLGPNSLIANGPAQFNNYTGFTNTAAFSGQAQFTGGATFGTAQVFFNSSVTFSADALMVTPAAADNSQRAATTAWVRAYAGGAYLPLAGGTMTGLLTLSANPTANLGAATKQYVDSTTVSLAGDTMTGPLVLSADPTAALGAATKQYVDAGDARQNRSRIINGQFRVNQRSYASGTALAAAAYGHDRWKAGAGGCTYTFTASGAATTITITAGSLQQIIENVNIEGGTFTLSWTGTAQGRVNAGAYGASPLTVSGLAAATAVTVEFNAGTLANVQFEAGSAATPFDWRHYGQELALCQRYYQTFFVVPYGYNVAAGNVLGNYSYPVAMRASPTVGFSNISATNATGLVATSVTTSSFSAQIAITATGTGFATANAIFNAEL